MAMRGYFIMTMDAALNGHHYLSDVSGAVLEIRAHVNSEEDVVIESQFPQFDQSFGPAERALIPVVVFNNWPAAQFNYILD
jgi:hypothetical protein